MLRLGTFPLYFAGTILLALKRTPIIDQSEATVLLKDSGLWNGKH